MKKKILSMVLLVAMSISLCACGKSKDVKNVEEKINALNSESTYQEIYETYRLTRDLSEKEHEKVENLSVLAEYCDIKSGDFVLTEDMVIEMSEMFDSRQSKSISSAFTSSKTVKKTCADWKDYGDVVWSTVEKEDNYSMVASGTIKIIDKYGKVATHELSITYHAQYDSESEKGYKINASARISEYPIK